MANKNNECRRQFVVDPAYATVKRFGQHPRFSSSYRAAVKYAFRHTPEKYFKLYERPVSEYGDSRHPHIYILPSNRFYQYTDEYDDCIAQRMLPFSSTNFYVDSEHSPLFSQFDHQLFLRLGDLPQLQLLVPPYPTDDPEGELIFTEPPFPHNRWIHCLLPAIMAEIILARQGFSAIERAPFVLTIGYHDAATPAGGDSVKRIDPANLDEEKNFSLVIERAGLAEKWKKQFGFNLEVAAAWVKNEGLFGLLLDILDKISYVALDCYYLGHLFDGNIRRHGQAYPLFMDIWQDIRFTPDQRQFAFTDADRLFIFLLARAYEFQELLYNPAARFLDFHLTKLVEPLYKGGKITLDHLLTWSWQDLEFQLTRHYGQTVVRPSIINAAEYQWKKFDSETEMLQFKTTLSDSFSHTEHISGFNPNLNWPVFAENGTDIVPIGERLPADKVDLLKSIVASTRGYYIYWHTPTP